MKTTEITKEDFQGVEKMFQEDYNGYNFSYTAKPLKDKKYRELADWTYHTDWFLVSNSNNHKCVSVDVKGFSFAKNNTMHFYFAQDGCTKQWGDSSIEGLRAFMPKNIDILGEYVVIPYKKDGELVWAWIDRTTLKEKIGKYAQNTPKNAYQKKNREEIIPPFIYWKPTKMSSPRYALGITPPEFEELVVKYTPRSNEIRYPNGTTL